jgi:hypothetical protein
MPPLARERKYWSNAERQAAYRQRKAQEEDRDRRIEVPEILVKTLGMLGSAHAGERANASEGDQDAERPRLHLAGRVQGQAEMSGQTHAG